MYESRDAPQCSKCGQSAIMRLEYCHADFCASCFSLNFEQKVARAVREFKLIQKGDVVAVGVSGGKDSGALFFSLQKLCEKIGGVTLKPVLVDEGIEGYRNKAAECAERVTLKPVLVDEGIEGYRNKAAECAEQLCERLGTKLERISYSQAFGISMDEAMKKRELAEKIHRSCSYCGVFRKYCLNKAARSVGASKLAIGHNQDDITQTFLMNLMRGEPSRNDSFAAYTGSSNRTLFVPRIRPLIYCTELECAHYCVLNEIPFHRGAARTLPSRSEAR